MIQAEKKVWLVLFSREEASWLWNHVPKILSSQGQRRIWLWGRQDWNMPMTTAVPECTAVQCADLQEPCRCWEAPTIGLLRGWAASTECSSPPHCFGHPASDSVASKPPKVFSEAVITVYAFRLLTCVCLSFQMCWFFTILHIGFVVVCIYYDVTLFCIYI